MKVVTLFKSMVVVGMGALALIVAPSAALATRVTPANSAVPVSPTNLSCLALFYAGFQNSCASTIDVIVPLDADNAGAKTASVTVNGPNSAHTVGCTFVAVDQNITLVRTSGQHFPTTFGSAAQIPLTISGGSFSNGPIYVECNVDPTAMLYSVSFNQ